MAATGRGKAVRRFPLIGGIDVVGEVVESADPAYLPGDQVLATGFGLSEEHDGGYAPYLTIVKQPSSATWPDLQRGIQPGPIGGLTVGHQSTSGRRDHGQA